MTSPNLKLVYSNSNSDKAKVDLEQWKVESLDGLELFDYNLDIVVFATKTANCNQFFYVLENIKPSLVIETCLYQGYHKAFNSYSHELEEYRKRRIKYDHIPLQFRIKKSNNPYRPIEDIKASIRKNHDKCSPILVLTTSEFHCEEISKRLKCFCTNNLPNANIEEMNFNNRDLMPDFFNALYKTA